MEHAATNRRMLFWDHGSRVAPNQVIVALKPVLIAITPVIIADSAPQHLLIVHGHFIHESEGNNCLRVTVPIMI